MDERIANQFFENGYTITRDILSEDELDILRDKMAQMIDSDPVSSDASFDQYGNVVEHSSDFAFVDLDNQRQILARISNQLARSSVMRLVYANPTLLRLVESVYGREFVPFAESIVIKLPENGSAFPFHQDGNRYKGIQHRGLNVGIYLHASTETNGCLRVIPGSHLLNKIDVHALRELHGPILPDSIRLETQIGDITLHDRSLVHGSLPNTSSDLRITVYFGFHKLASVIQLHDAERIKKRAQVISLCIHERQQSDRYSDETPYDYALSDLAPHPTSPEEISAVLRETALGI